MTYSYEEIRQVVFDISSGRENGAHVSAIDQFISLENAVAKTFVVRDGASPSDMAVHNARLSDSSSEDFREVFWDLILQQIIVPSINRDNPNLPFFKVTSRGKKYLDQDEAYFFHDVASYESRIRESIPDIDDLTLLYLKEAMQAFRSGCLLSSVVMLGVASENEFLMLINTLEASSKWERIFKKVFKQRFILGKINSFQTALESMPDPLPSRLTEDLETTLGGVHSIIRNHRNDSGHPTGIIMKREQCFVLLQVFIPYAKKLHELDKFFSK